MRRDVRNAMSRPTARTSHGLSAASPPTRGCLLPATSSHGSTPTATDMWTSWPDRGMCAVVVKTSLEESARGDAYRATLSSLNGDPGGAGTGLEGSTVDSS